jgi:hypothetical protein
MATTNKLIFKEQVQELIINGLCEDYYTELPFQLAQVVEEFTSYANRYELKMYGSYQACFKNFIQGMPSCLYITCYNDEILETYKSWFTNIDVDYKEPVKDRDIEKTYDLFYYFIFREFKTLCKKNGVEVSF